MLKKANLAGRAHGGYSLLASDLLAGKRHVLHAGQEGLIVAVVRSASPAVAHTRSGLLAIVGSTRGCVGVAGRIGAVVGRCCTIVRAWWVICTVVHGAAASSYIWITAGKGTIATVHLLLVLLTLSPRRDTIRSLRGVGWKLVREGVVTLIKVCLRGVVTTAA
jgi:hypothetical protein